MDEFRENREESTWIIRTTHKNLEEVALDEGRGQAKMIGAVYDVVIGDKEANYKQGGRV